MLNLAAAVERAADVRHHPLRGGVLPDVAGVHAAVADADRPDAAPRAERRPKSRSGRAIRRRRSSPSRTSRRALLAGLNVVGTVLHGIDTDSFTFRETPDDYLLFLGRFTEGKGVLQAIEVARRVGMRLMLAAAENDYYREHVAPHVDGSADRLPRRSGLRDQGRAVRRRARPALSDAGARAVRAGARRGDGLRHAGRRARPRRRPRDRRRRRHRRACSSDLEQMVDGLPRVLALDRRRVRERAVARFGVAAHGRRLRRRLPADRRRRIVARMPGDAAGLAGRTVLAVFAHPDDESLACGGTLARLADAGARVVLLCASRGERGGPTGPVRDDALGAVRASELRDAAAALGIAEVILLDHPDGDLRWAHVAEFHARDRRCRPPLRAGARHHVRRRRPLLAPRSHRRPRAHDHRGALARRRRAAALLRHDAARHHAADRRGRAVARVGAAAEAASGASSPDAFGHAARTRRRSSSTSSDWVPRKLAALLCHRTQMGPAHPFDAASNRRKPSAGSASSTSTASRRSAQPAVLELIGELTQRRVTESTLCESTRSTSCAARSAAAASSSSPRCSTGMTGDEIRRRHPRLPLLHLSGRRRHPGPAPAAARDRGARAGRGRTVRRWRCRTMVGLDDERAGGAVRGGCRRPDTATYRELVEALGPSFEGGYFLYRFSDPTFIVANAVVRAVGRHGAARHGGAPSTSAAAPAISPGRCWTCRRRRRCSPTSTSRRSGWRAASPRRAASRCAATATRRCRSRAARSATRCARTRFMFIWTKRQFVGEMVAADRRRRANRAPCVISHTHNQLHLEPVARPAADAGRLSRSVRDARAADLRRSGPVRGRRRRRPARSVAASIRRPASTPIRR